MRRALLVVPLLVAACGPRAPPRPQEQPDVVIVAMDNVRWDATSLGDPAADRTPSLRELAAQPGAVTFTRAYAAAPFSLASYSSLLTGRDAPEHGVGFRTLTMPASETTLAEVLKAYGWRTAAFTAGAQVSKETGLNQGFDAFDEGPTLGPLLRSVQAAERWLDTSGDAPRLLFVHGYDAHIPYRAPGVLAERYDRGYQGIVHAPGFLSMGGLASIANGIYAADTAAFRGGQPPPETPLTPADRAHVAAHYHAAVRGADYALGTLLSGLQARGIFDEAVVIVLADHGEELGEHGRFQHGARLDDAVLHVPLVVRFPRGGRARTYDGVVSLTDVLPTLLDHLGLTQPAELDGESLLPALAGGPPPRDGIARAAGSKYYAARDAHVLLTRELATGRQALEGARDPGAERRLATAFERWPAALGTDAEGTDPALLQKLRDGGYWTLAEEAE